MLEDIQNTINRLETLIAVHEQQLNLMKKELQTLKDELLSQTKITGAKSRTALPDSFEKLFEQFTIKDDTNGISTRAFNSLNRSKLSIEDLNNISFIDLSAIRNASGHTVAVIIAVLEHFGITIEIPKDFHGCSVTGNKIRYAPRIAKDARNLLPQYRERIIFK